MNRETICESIRQYLWSGPDGQRLGAQLKTNKKDCPANVRRFKEYGDVKIGMEYRTYYKVYTKFGKLREAPLHKSWTLVDYTATGHYVTLKSQYGETMYFPVKEFCNRFYVVVPEPFPDIRDTDEYVRTVMRTIEERHWDNRSNGSLP